MAKCQAYSMLLAPIRTVIPRACGVSSTPRRLGSIKNVSGILDRPPSRATTIEAVLRDTTSRSRGAVHPRFAFSFPPEEGVGNAGCQRTRSRACSVESTRVSHHGCAETPGIPARNGFNGFLRDLPGDRAFLSPSPAKTCFRQLDAGVEASGPHDFSVRFSAVRQKNAAASTASRPNVRDDGQRPSLKDRTAADIK
ncbi:hypothetical protein SAMN05444169_1983 [Bradyrhizobium erythrophlei]|uniref:Uncharacterized protein n=1 Tax=Bradyrhizobium erythrophlei TaxID=1437360 RepID=A0A1M5J585_9BRAD|nr:hypothetical protein SAMN05444169_1983 [Bradyrhizobium erythrophlei]